MASSSREILDSGWFSHLSKIQPERLLLGSYNIWHTDRKSHFLHLLSLKPTSYGKWFPRYWILADSVIWAKSPRSCPYCFCLRAEINVHLYKHQPLKVSAFNKLQESSIILSFGALLMLNIVSVGIYPPKALRVWLTWPRGCEETFRILINFSINVVLEPST